MNTNVEILSIGGYLVGRKSSLGYQEKLELVDLLIDAFYELSANVQRRMLRSWNGGLGACFDHFHEDLSLFVDVGDYDHVQTIEDAKNEHWKTIKQNEEFSKKA